MFWISDQLLVLEALSLKWWCKCAHRRHDTCTCGFQGSKELSLPGKNFLNLGGLGLFILSMYLFLQEGRGAQTLFSRISWRRLNQALSTQRLATIKKLFFFQFLSCRLWAWHPHSLVCGSFGLPHGPAFGGQCWWRWHATRLSSLARQADWGHLPPCLRSVESVSIYRYPLFIGFLHTSVCVRRVCQGQCASQSWILILAGLWSQRHKNGGIIEFVSAWTQEKLGYLTWNRFRLDSFDVYKRLCCMPPVLSIVLTI